MHNTLKRAVIATNQKAQYDAKVKNLLGHKIILAHILTRTVDESQEGDPLYRRNTLYQQGADRTGDDQSRTTGTADYRSEYGKRGNKRGTDKI